MIPKQLLRRLLVQLFECAQQVKPADLFDLCAGSGASPYAVLRALHALEQAGFVDARRLRLTLSGLAAATALAGPERAEPAAGNAGEPLAGSRHAA